MKKENNIFLVFGALEAITLGLIVFFILQGLNTIGRDTQIVLSVLFPIFLVIVEYMIYSKK
jgi:hypothetical protein